MSQARLWQGLKKSVIGIYFWIRAVGSFIDQFGPIDLSGINICVPPYLFLLILLFAYVHIGNVYKEKLPGQPSFNLSRQQKLLLGAGAFVVVSAGIAINRWLDTPISGSSFALALFFILLWAFWDRQSWFGLFLAAVFAFDAFLPLFLADNGLASILFNLAFGAAFFAGGIKEHRALMRETISQPLSAKPET